MKGRVPRRQRQTEEVQAVGDGGGELEDEARDRQAVAAVQLHAQAADIDVLQHVITTCPVEHILPGSIAVGAGKDAEVAGAQRGGGAVAVGVVEPESTFEHLPVRVHLGQSAGQARIANGATSELRLPIAYDAQGAGLKDAVHEGLATLTVEHTRLVVVGVGREERIAGGEVE